MTHPLRYYIPRVPIVYWYVMGRKQFDRRIPPKIRAMWKVGNYAKEPEA